MRTRSVKVEPLVQVGNVVGGTVVWIPQTGLHIVVNTSKLEEMKVGLVDVDDGELIWVDPATGVRIVESAEMIYNPNELSDR